MGIFSKIANLFTRKDKSPVSAIILCAGESTRFESDENKQMALVNGICVAERTIRVFDNCKRIREIVLVVRKEDAQAYKTFIFEKGFAKVTCIVTGGETRQISALRGFKHISEDSEYVAIHDGARCLITESMINDVIDAAIEYNAATAAYKVTDTVKISDENGFIKTTVDREYVWHVQTPQIFDTALYKKALIKAKNDELTVTDDCMLLENLDVSVKLVNTGESNIKITFKEDIARAEAILSQRGDS